MVQSIYVLEFFINNINNWCWMNSCSDKWKKKKKVEEKICGKNCFCFVRKKLKLFTRVYKTLVFWQWCPKNPFEYSYIYTEKKRERVGILRVNVKSIIGFLLQILDIIVSLWTEELHNLYRIYFSRENIIFYSFIFSLHWCIIKWRRKFYVYR